MKVQDRNLEVTATETRFFGEVEVIGEFSDTSEGFAFRLRIKQGITGNWVSHYHSFASVSQNGREYRMCSSYWDGSFPTETPFEIVEGKELGEQ